LQQTSVWWGAANSGETGYIVRKHARQHVGAIVARYEDGGQELLARPQRSDEEVQIIGGVYWRGNTGIPHKCFLRIAYFESVSNTFEHSNLKLHFLPHKLNIWLPSIMPLPSPRPLTSQK